MNRRFKYDDPSEEVDFVSYLIFGLVVLLLLLNAGKFLFV